VPFYQRAFIGCGKSLLKAFELASAGEAGTENMAIVAAVTLRHPEARARSTFPQSV
jgi:hypothetical protein